MDRKNWHPALCGATEWEFLYNKEDLEFDREYVLSKESLKMDLLIIRKNSKAVIENEIGKLFRGHNIVEFKGHGDSLNIDDYYKTIGYACLYKGLGKHVNEIPAEELTVTLMREAYPRELFRRLKESGLRISGEYPGIYYIEGNTLFPIQVIVIRELDERHAALRILSDNAKEADVRKFLEDTKGVKEKGDRENIDAVLQVSVAANRGLYDRIQEDKNMCQALRELMKDEIDREVEQGREQGIKQGIEQGEKRSTLNAIRKMMEKMKLTAQQAMDVLDIAAEDRKNYIAML